MNATRPPLRAEYSQNHTTIYVGPQGRLSPDPDAFVYCQHKKRTCRRDSFSHSMHTAIFNAGTWARKAVCLPSRPGVMPFATHDRGRAPQSPLRPESLPPPRWPTSMG